MSNLMTRAIFGALFVAVLVFCILFHEYSLFGIFLLITVLGLIEFYRLNNIKHLSLVSVILGAGVYVFASFSPSHSEVWNYEHTGQMIVLFSILSTLMELFHKQGSFKNAAIRVIGIIYIAVPFSMLNNYSNEWNSNAHLVLIFFVLVWTNDTGAYLSGRAFGKHKLFERISPKKTIEGLIGGGLLTVAVSYGIYAIIDHTYLSFPRWLIMAVIVFVFANLGDLVESMMKRELGIKDSGNIIPGHGGILDRFDGALLAMPVVYIWLNC